MEEIKSIEDMFFQWLSTQVSPVLLSDLYAGFQEISAYCIEKHVLKRPLFQTTDLFVLRQVANVIEHDRVFKFTYRKKINKLAICVKQYMTFVKAHMELTVAENCNEDVFQDESKKNNFVETKELIVKQSEKTNTISTASPKAKTVDFSNRERLPFTKPVSVTYFGETEEGIRSWKDLYVRVVGYLLDDYPSNLRKMINQNIGGQGRNDFADEFAQRTMVAHRKIQDDFYLETNLSATDIIAKIKHLLDICNIDYENLEIKYVEKEQITQSLNTAVSLEPIENHDPIDISENRKNFISWMNESGIDVATMLGYLSAIGYCTKLANKANIVDRDLLVIDNSKELLRIKNLLFTITSVKKVNDQQHNRYLFSLNKLIAYRNSTNHIHGAFQNYDTSTSTVNTEPIENVAISGMDMGLQNKYVHILESRFGEDGYQPGRAIFRGRFKRFYADEYGMEPTETDECIDMILSKVGTMRDGRVFPKQDDEQNHLIDDIIGDIVSALDNDATGVYIDAVYEKYQQQLAEGLQIYNQDALTTMLLTYGKGRYAQRHSYLSKHGRNAELADDILKIMKSFHEPQNYAAIHEKAWFIPYDKMKNFLVWDKSIVNVAAETYFYAPNLPVSSDELKQLILFIKAELEYRNYITDVKMIEIIRTKCPSMAINTESFTTFGLRNCLGYILRDYFSFNGPIISELGKEISMSDVYGEFARNQEVLHIDNLKAFSKEMDTIIYWDSVIDEMIRISDQEMVRRDLISFDVNAIDEVLEGMCPQEYISLKAINLFLYFPNIGYQWNQYILESYLFKNSRKFKLLHNSFGQSDVCGAMVRVNSSIGDYRALIVDVLARSNALDSTKAALQFIVDQGYQQRRSLNGIEMLMQEAKMIKEQRKNEEE